METVKTPKKLPFKDMILFGNSGNKFSEKKPSDNSKPLKSSQTPEILLIINVDIGKSEETKIYYHQNDDPGKLAEDFCKLNNLDLSLKRILQNNIEQKVNEFVKTEINVKSKIKQKEIIKNKEIHENKLSNYDKGISQSAKKLATNPYSNYMSEKKSRGREEIQTPFTFSPKINDISKEIMKLKNKESVYKRLYLEAETKKNNNNNFNNNHDKSLEYSKKPRAKSAKNIGHQMYEKAMIRLERMKENEKLMKMKEQESILKECSHKPHVNPISEMIVEYKRKDKNFKKVEQFLLNYVDSKNENLKKATTERFNQVMKECTFKPKINNFLSDKKPKKNNVYEELYNDCKAFELKKQNAKAPNAENFTFHPHINNTANKMAQDFDFFQRMQIFDEMKKQKLQSNFEKANSLFDTSTGQTYFQPKINEISRSRDDLTNKIWESLYNTRFRKAQYISECIAKERIDFNFGIPKLTTRTEEILEEKKLNLVIQMFGFFDSDNDGVISVDKINLENAPKEFLKVLIPISLKIAENTDGMGVEEFYKEFDKVYRGLNCQEKADLYKRSSEIGGDLMKEMKESSKNLQTEPRFENYEENETGDVGDYNNSY